VPETITTPSLSGPSNGAAGASYSFTATDAALNFDHSVQCQFTWSDRTSSGLLSVNTSSTPRQGAHRKGLLHRHIPGDDGDREHADIRRPQRHDERQRIAGSGIGIDQHRALHRIGVPPRTAATPIVNVS
jgi:hypothetical protein